MLQELLSIYTEILKAATDDQIPQHLENLVKDATAITEAVKAVITEAKSRAGQQG